MTWRAISISGRAYLERGHDGGEAEVRHLDGAEVVQQDVLGLEVAVDHAPLVAELHRRLDLSEQVARAVLPLEPARCCSPYHQNAC
jgi:hypothetical protein